MRLNKKIIDHPLFFKWIYNPTSSLEDYWKEYIENNPDEKQEIGMLKKEFERLKFSSEHLTGEEKEQLALRIKQKLDLIDKQRSRKRIFTGFLRYAAVGFLFFMLGSVGVYLMMSQNRTIQLDPDFSIPVGTSEAMLIVNGQEKIYLGENESVLDHSLGDSIVLNESRSISVATDQKTPPMNQLILPYGTRSKVTLADGTTVWLNAGSRLQYPSSFKDKKREVFLTGEALFDVTEDKTRPFIVNTSDIKIRVLGTKFNLSAYPEDEMIQTVLEEGAIALSIEGSGWFEKDLELKPNQMATIDKVSREASVEMVDASTYSTWIEGVLSFEDAELRQVIQKLERFYDIHFNYSNPLKGQMQISGKLDLNKQQKEVFEYLEKVTGVMFVQIDAHNYLVK